MSYLRNTWYVAAWDDEVQAGTLLARVLLNEPVVMFRDADGCVRALQDRCPHRFAPLHIGTLDGDAVQCRYHGLKFNGQGDCVHSPYGAIPRAARVRSYPVAELYSMIWIWMGEADRTDVSLIPDFSFQDPAHWYVGKGYLSIKASYELEIDNILDLSHIEFLHPTTLGSSGVSKGNYECIEDGDVVWSNRSTVGEVMSDRLSLNMGVESGTPVDRWINVRWTAPACMVIFSGAVPTGRPRSEGQVKPSSHFFTPKAEKSSHYWFSLSVARSLGEGGESIVADRVQYLRFPFEAEDQPMLEAQQKNLGDQDLWSLRPVWLPGDAGGTRARSVLRRMIAEELENR